jgi:histidinol phosphatase-like PHP family hydrolase
LKKIRKSYQLRKGNSTMLIQSDYHIHASFYRIKKAGDQPGPTAAEQLAAARNSGSVYVGLLEHCNTAAKHPFSCLEELSREFYSADFPRENVFLGVESDLADDGSDHCGKAGREILKLDYVIGSVHWDMTKGSTLEEYIKAEHLRITSALKHNANVDIIGHPFGEGIRWERSGAVPKWHWGLIPESCLENILRLARESGKALEINRCDFSDPVYLDFLGRMRDEKVLFEVGSDAHAPNCSAAAERTRKLEELGFSEEYHWKVCK